jgi:hypothetical protein
MHIRSLLLGSIALIGLAAVSLPALADDYDCNNINREVYISNGSSSEIESLVAYNRDDMDYGGGNNLLDGLLEPGDSTWVSVNDYTGYHIYEIEVQTYDGLSAMVELDACDSDASWTITDDQFEDDY